MKQFRSSRFPVALAFCILGALSAAGWAAPTSAPTDTETVAQGNNAFATRLYSRLARSETGNLFFSPYSITTALAMTYNGAEGKTAAQMSHVLNFTLPLGRMDAAFSALSSELDSNSEVDGAQVYDLTLANALWTQNGFSLNSNFLQTVTQDFGANVQQADFMSNPTQAVDDINNWVAEQTDNLIQDLLSPSDVTVNTRIVLVNAIYFLGNWESPFDAILTSDQPFHVSAKSEVSAPMMNQEETLSYMENQQVQIAEFPYVGENLSIVVILPRSVQGLGAVEKNLTVAKLKQWLGKMSDYRVNTYLPKFQLQSQFDLSNTLSAMGMPAAFSRQANFSGISADASLQISHVIHKAFVDVNEVGTKAAAATGVIGTTAIAVPSPTAVFRADHPFLFLIRDQTSGAILFMGRVTDPTE